MVATLYKSEQSPIANASTKLERFFLSDSCDCPCFSPSDVLSSKVLFYQILSPFYYFVDNIDTPEHM